MILTADDFAECMAGDPADAEGVSLGDALRELAVDEEVDAVEVVRDVREQI